MKHVYVKWEDHSSGNGWAKNEDIDTKPVVVETTGWVLKEDKRVLVLINTIDQTSEASVQRMYVLKSDILKRKTVRL